MKKNYIRVAALLVVLASLVLCFSACGEKANTITVDVRIFELDSGEKSIWLGRKELVITDGSTADQAVAALCEKGEATYTKDNSGMYDSFKFNKGSSIKMPSTKTLEDGTQEYYHYGWSLNGEIMSNIDNYKKLSDYVMKDGDKVEIFIQKDVIKVSN